MLNKGLVWKPEQLHYHLSNLKNKRQSVTAYGLYFTFAEYCKNKQCCSKNTILTKPCVAQRMSQQ